MASRRGLALDGVLLLDKPEGLSSNHALQRARRILDARKAGHTGTLDPFATGLMVLCFGEATKFSGDLFHADKAYRADVLLGEETDSGDLTGHPVVFDGQDAGRAVDEAQLHDVLSRFRGSIEQVPPMVSALKRDGKPLYAYAREGIELEREPRRVTIFDLALLSRDDRRLVLDVHCSKGTYIRTLAQDIGRALGCGAHLTALRRTSTAGFDLAQAVTLAQLEALPDPASALLPIEALLGPLPVACLDAETARRFSHGQTVRQPAGDEAADAGRAPVAMEGNEDRPRRRVRGPNDEFLGTARLEKGWLHPDRLISFKERS